MENRLENGQQEKIEKLITDLKTVVQDGQDLLRSSMGSLRQRAASGVQATERIVHERPYQSLGLAFGMGLLVGALAIGLLSGPGTRAEQIESES